jgi:benzoate membrane transport protein
MKWVTFGQENSERGAHPGAAGPLIAGVITALVGYSSAFAVVLTGLHAVGASRAQAASGLTALCLVQAAAMWWLSRRYRTPLVIVWSTPGVALLATTGAVDGGWPAAVGAFMIAGAAYVVTGLWPWLGSLIARIPPPIAQAMLAGVVLDLCVAPARAASENPWAIAPIAVVWLIVARFAARWAVPAAFVAACVVIGVDLARTGNSVVAADLVPTLALTSPEFTFAALIGIAVPLYIVTMASQNVPGVSIMASYGYDVPWRSSMIATGVATAAGASAGAHSVNLGAISAALAAGPDAGPDRSRRWLAAQSAAVVYVLLAAGSSALATIVSVAPVGVIATVAGLALLGTLADAVASSVAQPQVRQAAIVTFVVAVSGVSLAGIGAAFWALLAGLAVHAVLFRKHT